ncbi:hypothetical protein BN1723_016247 [Verticillium longisporum]|uniref:Zn(2)-C6 fungal-type domain-containing protein n=1 Tax=Verticillium longisporum TaxID=100787 RepID=A0A0G4LYK7_VERLO|nr:hypothetical protein BN1708_004352 [Verticillium longisporum]CRK43712.1 hypothetical protein BN1723_016247 [Verticillium longisporum]
MIVFRIGSQDDGKKQLHPAPGRACDHCRYRKMKCDRREPCRPCRDTQSPCTYASMPKRKGRPPRKDRQHSKTKHQQAKLRDQPSLASACSSSPRNGLHNPPDSGSKVAITSPPNELPVLRHWSRAGTLFENSLEASTLTASAESMPQAGGGPFPIPSNSLESHQPGLEAQPQELNIATAYPVSEYAHWTRVFLLRLYPVFPIMDPGCLLSKLALPQGLVSPSLGRFFAAMSAAVIVQLNLTDPNVDGLDVAQTSGQVLSMRLADKYISQCFAGRHDRSYIEDADEWTIMESFFIFSYYGNCNTSKQAWYHLREAISFALALGLNREESYSDPSLEVNERRRRLYWAYCLQHRTTPILRASIALPRIYDGADEPTLSGFVKLARLFNTIDTDFVCSWSEGYLKGSNDSVARLLDPDQFSTMSLASIIDETQRVDVAVTQCWLRTLVCQLQIRSNESHGQGAATSVRAAARDLLNCFSAARLEILGSHGIGMEQKISDIAGFLCDLLPRQPPEQLIGDMDSIPNLLHSFMCLLANFRNQESCYLGPLAERATALLMQRGIGRAIESCDEVEQEGYGSDDEVPDGVWQNVP